MGKMTNNYSCGDGFDIDEDKAFEFATKAAEASDELGMYYLGLCYDQGIGVKKGGVSALKWYERCNDVYADSANNNSGLIYSWWSWCEEGF